MHLQREEFLAIIWNFWRCLLVYRVISITEGGPEKQHVWQNHRDTYSSPRSRLHQCKAVGISSPAARVIFWQSHKPSSSQQFHTWCWYKYRLFCLPCVHGQGHNCNTDFLSRITQAGKEGAGNPGFRSEIKHLRKIFMYRIILQRESADP